MDKGKKMLKSELLEIIANGENSGVEFKRDDLRPEQLAKEITALANLQGGIILIGVEDDGTISGIQRQDLEAWVMDTVIAHYVHPMLLPFYQTLIMDSGKKVAVITIPQGTAKPYVLRHKDREEIYIRLGSTSRLATREQQMRLFETGGFLHVEALPVNGSSLADLDINKLDYYLRTIIKDSEIPESNPEWEERLLGMGLMAVDNFGKAVCSIAGMVCFGFKPRRFLHQSGLRVMSFKGNDKEYQAQLDVILDAPLIGRWRIDSAGQKMLADDGLIEKLIAAISPFISQEASEIDEHWRREKILR
jgi:ATP-dependent DNA helicase RecG